LKTCINQKFYSREVQQWIIAAVFVRDPEKMVFSGGNNKLRNFLRKESIMAYKKPQMVAKSIAKKSYVAGCPSKTSSGACVTVSCEIYKKM
jgi:hypothetical protein